MKKSYNLSILILLDLSIIFLDEKKLQFIHPHTELLQIKNTELEEKLKAYTSSHRHKNYI
jgi:hypothetical protein